MGYIANLDLVYDVDDKLSRFSSWCRRQAQEVIPIATHREDSSCICAYIDVYAHAYWGVQEPSYLWGLL